MSTHKIGFYEEISKIITYHQISSNTHLMSSAAFLTENIKQQTWHFWQPDYHLVKRVYEQCHHEKTKVTMLCVQLISHFIFTTYIVHVQPLYFLNPLFQASRHLLWLYRQVCVESVRKPQRQVFS